MGASAPADERAEPGGLDEVDFLQIDDEVDIPGDQPLRDGALELWSRGEVDLALWAEDGVAVTPGHVDLELHARPSAEDEAHRCVLNESLVDSAIYRTHQAIRRTVSVRQINGRASLHHGDPVAEPARRGLAGEGGQRRGESVVVVVVDRNRSPRRDPLENQNRPLSPRSSPPRSPSMVTSKPPGIPGPPRCTTARWTSGQRRAISRPPSYI